jgi:hypothetical protein
MKNALKIFGKIILVIIVIWIALSFVEYDDKSRFIRPVAEKMLYNSKKYKSKNILTKNEIVLMLKESGCGKVSVIKSDIVTSLKDTKYEITNHWFRAKCFTEENKLINISITANKKVHSIRTDMSHSYCFDVMSNSISCYMSSFTTLFHFIKSISPKRIG